MNRHHPSSSSGVGLAIAVALLLALLLVGAIGLGAGFFLFSARSQVMMVPPTATKMATTPAAASSPVAAPTADVIGTFPLGELDIKETLESPALAATKD